MVRERGYKNLNLLSEHVTEIEYRPARAKGTYRMIILRKRIEVEKGQKRLFDQQRYLFYVTNVPVKELSTQQVVLESNGRCNQENVIEQLKNGVQALRMPADTLVANWTYLVIAAQAWNLKVWLGLLLPARHGGPTPDPDGVPALCHLCDRTALPDRDNGTAFIVSTAHC